MEHQDLEKLFGKPESELIEFKLAENDYDSGKLCNYVSALANEANIQNRDFGYLIFGVEPKKHAPVGTNYRLKNLQSIKHDIFQKTQHSVFIEENKYEEKRLVIFRIPRGPRGVIVKSSGISYGRENESLVPLTDVKREMILSQNTFSDWSAEIIPNTSIDDLEPEAIKKARINFIEKNKKIPENEINSWSDIEFLNRATITKEGKITRTALILLGKESSYHKLGGIAQITWVLKDKDNYEKDYEHFYPPFIISVEHIFEKIRNLKYRYLQEGTIFPDEVQMYDSWVLRELLHNCIAHQDYTMQSRVNLVEYEDGRLIFDNIGEFIPENIDTLIESESPPKFYRNPFLAKAMFQVAMIDTMGSGIKRVYKTQRERFFPLPTYSFENKGVKVELYGKMLDMKYANILVKNTNLTLQEIILLDKIQKKKIQELNKDGVQILKKQGLVEGRYPNVYLSGDISKKIGKQTEYMRLKGFDDDYYTQMILEYLERYKKAHKQEIKDLLWNKLPDILTEKQKEDKIRNLLNVRLAKGGYIRSISGKTGSIKDRVWIKN